MIDIKTETLITVAQARDEIPHRPSTATIWRWMLKGVRGVELESVHIGGRRFTSAEACARFIARCTEAAEQRVHGSKRRNDRAVEKAKAILDMFGI